MLAGHLSGIRKYRGTEGMTNPPMPNLRSGLKVFENDPLESAPGAKFSYASYNWNLLGAIMETATNQDFLTFMSDHVIQPLGLHDTVPDRSDHCVSRRARCYEVGPSGEFLFAPRRDFSSLWPSGGYLSSAEDLCSFRVVADATRFPEGKLSQITLYLPKHCHQPAHPIRPGLDDSRRPTPSRRRHPQAAPPYC